MRSCEIWACFTPNTRKMGRNWQIPSAKTKCQNNFETVRDTRNMSMNHDYETGVALSDSVNKNCMKRPLAKD